MSQQNLPNFLYLGPDKAGSSWLFAVLQAHPQVYVTPAKDLYFFAPQIGRGGDYYHRGLDWYAGQFRGGDKQLVRCELSHDYLFSDRAAQRIARDLPDVRLMVCLREPVSRAFSAYLHLRMSGGFQGTFEQAVEAYPSLLDHGLYHRHLQPYLERFGPERIFVGIFDDLVDDPTAFCQCLFAYLNLEPINLPEHVHERVLPAGQARSKSAAYAAQYSADLLRRLGLARLLGRLKSSPQVRRLLYKPYASEDRPKLSNEQVAQMRPYFQNDLLELDKTLKTNLAKGWGYLNDQ